MAALVDAVNQNTFAFVAANSKRKPKEPQPVWTPMQQKRKQRQKQTNLFAMTVQAKLNELKKES